MYTTIFLKGPYAPGGYDWIHASSYQTDSAGVKVFVTRYGRTDSYFFPWCNVERIG